MDSRIAGVIGPIRACCGSSATPGWPRQVTISNWGRAEGPSQRGQRAHRIAQSRVLHHRDAAPMARVDFAGERDSGNQRHRIALIAHRYVTERGVLQHVVDERRQVRAGDAGIPPKAAVPRRLDKLLCLDHRPSSRGAVGRRAADRRLRVREIDRETQIIEVVDAAPVAVHVQKPRSPLRRRSARSAVPAYRACQNSRAHRNSSSAAFSLPRPRPAHLQHADPTALNCAARSIEAHAFVPQTRSSNTGVPNKSRSSLREQYAKSRTV